MATRNAAPKSKSWSDRLDRLASRGRAKREQEKEDKKTRQLAINAAATLQLVGADDAVMERIANEILDRRLTDDSSGGTADTLVGEAMIETITGKPAPAFLPRAGEIARALIDAQANLQLVGIDDTDEARTLTDRIVREGLRGARAKEAVREVVSPVVKQVEADQQGESQGGSQATPPPEKRPTPDLADRIPSDHWEGISGGSSESATPAETPAQQPARDVSGVIDFSDIDFEPEAPTNSGLVPIEPADDFYGPDGAAEPGTPPSTEDDDILSSPSGNQENGNQSSNNNRDDSSTNDNDGSDDDNDDGDSAGNGDDDSQNTGGDDGSTPNESSDDQPAASGTPNPEREEAGSGFGLQEATGGRLGGDAARRQQDRLDLLGRGGGAAGPEAGENPASGVLLTPEERANASRLLGVKAGGGVTTPSPLKEGGTAITERDLKDLVLRGNGGAGTPEATVFPVLQPPQSPLAPPAGMPGVGGDPITGLGSAGNLRALPAFQRLGAFQRSAFPLGAAGTELGLADPHLFGTQAGGFVGAEIGFGGLAAIQAAPLLA